MKRILLLLMLLLFLGIASYGCGGGANAEETQQTQTPITIGTPGVNKVVKFEGSTWETTDITVQGDFITFINEASGNKPQIWIRGPVKISEPPDGVF
jgi:hypothetical protein